MGKASDEAINKTYAEYKQRELNEKGEYNGKVSDRHVINLCSTGISRWLKLGMLKNYAKTLKMIQLLKTKWLAWPIFSCMRLVTGLYLL